MCVRRAVDAEHVALAAEAIDAVLADLSPLAKRASADDDGAFVEDFCNWDRLPVIERFIRTSGVAAIAAELMGSDTVRLYHDHVLVKEPGTRQRTPWHQDQPYYNVDGRQGVSMWLPVDPVPRASTLELVAGSHQGEWFMPRSFLDDQAKWFPDGALAELPDIDGRPDDFRILGWELEPGDAVFFHYAHAARRRAACPARTAAGCCRSASSATTSSTRPGRGPRRRRSPGWPTSCRPAPRWTTRCSPSSGPSRRGRAVTVRPIATVGHPVLRQRAREVTPDELVSDEIQTLIDDLIDTMRHAEGAGLAANQVHEPVRIAVIHVHHNARYPYKPPIPLTVVVNPVIEPLDDELVEINEGCLSVPDLRGNVFRHVNVRVRYLDRHGVAHDEVKRGLTAGTFQHECDHLDGRLFLDRVADTTTLTTWEQFERFHRAAFVERITQFVERVGS